jgi:hypothetical protein
MGWRIAWLAALTVACGGTTSGGSDGDGGTGASGGEPATGGAPGTGGVTVAGAGSGGLGGSLPPPQADCVVAVHADQCCSQAVAVPSSALEVDPCLVPYGLQHTAAVAAVCPAAAQCMMLNCIFPAPPTRLAAASPTTGSCELSGECTTSADCTLAENLTYCCPCPEVFPAGLPQANPCISGSTTDFACNGCGDVQCEQCLPPYPVPACELNASGTFRVCVDGAI